MFELKNEKSYYKFLFQSSILALFAFIIVQMFKPSSFIGTFLIYTALELILFSTKFTDSVIVNSNRATVIYYRFFYRREIVFSISDIQSKISKEASLRSPVYLVLNIFQDNKKIYSIDSRDGFDDDDLIKLDQVLNTKTSSCT
jgi:hypothetical protein